MPANWYTIVFLHSPLSFISLIASFMGPTWGPSGADRTQVGPMLASWTLLSGMFYMKLHCMKLRFLHSFYIAYFLWRMAFLSPSDNQGLRVLYLICTFCFGIYKSYNLIKISWKAEKVDCVPKLEYIYDQSKLQIAFKNTVRLRVVLTRFSTVISFSRLEWFVLIYATGKWSVISVTSMPCMDVARFSKSLMIYIVYKSLTLHINGGL